MKLNILAGLATFLTVQAAVIDSNIVQEALKASRLVTRDDYQEPQHEMPDLAVKRSNETTFAKRSNSTIAKRSNSTLAKRGNETEEDKRSEIEGTEIGQFMKRGNETDMVIKKRYANIENELRKARLQD